MASGEKPEFIDIDPRTADVCVSDNIDKSDVKNEINKFRQRQRTQKEALKKKNENTVTEKVENPVERDTLEEVNDN
jgi:hypothetical protein